MSRRKPRLHADGRAVADHDGTEQELALLDSGFIPVHAEDVRPGESIAGRQEWFGRLRGPVETHYVNAVTLNKEIGEVLVRINSGEEIVPCDDWDTVWVKVMS